MKKGVLTVSDNKHIWLTLWEAMKLGVKDC